MSLPTNPHQLVIRRDTATGLTRVGWDEDLPGGRFTHLDLVCEVSHHSLPDSDSEHYAAYQTALQTARKANAALVATKISTNRAKGRYPVAFALAGGELSLQPDDIGNYSAAAMQLHYHLTRNIKPVWAVLQQASIVHLRPRQPHKPLDELSLQVWRHSQRSQLQAMGGTLVEGNLLVCESGLWLEVELST
ncbi:MAG: hypothetical protein OEZ39_02525 [Gammaproteobacteria bacterium]|nr:hypothetical protein [Gammaproteobacteria bacterium]MDH5650730.1 hypothetical protein [Gammaproteobacteria bacterium]